MLSSMQVTSNVRAMFYRFAASQGRATVGLHQPKIDIHISEVCGIFCIEKKKDSLRPVTGSVFVSTAW